MDSFYRSFSGWVSVSLLVLLSPLSQAASRADPEPATGLQSRVEAVAAERMLVVTAHPEATRIGYQVLRQGGSAADAAVAVQAALTMVEPQSSGIGGGAFLLHWDAAAQRLQAFDGRETAPAQADGDLFIGADGKPMAWRDALVGGRSVGVPGVLRMLELVQQQHGKLPWSTLFDQSITLAEQGFEVTPRLHQMLVDEINPGIKRYPQARDYFYPGGEPLAVGARLQNPALAKVLSQIASEGADYLYQGEMADKLVQRVRGAEDNRGRLSQRDLLDYRAKERVPLCRAFLQYRVCGMPPPTSGGATVLQILGILEGYELAGMDPHGAEFAHLMTQASRLAYADRGRYLADSDFVPVPLPQLLDPAYLKARADMIDPQQDMGKAQAGEFDGISLIDGRSPELPSTTHFVIVDKEGNAVSMTSSIEMAFGSTLMVDGFLLNNQLTDFSFVAERDGLAVANRVEPGKRPRSSMSPMMVFDQDDRLILLGGSPGGSRIINYVAQMLLGSLVWQLPIEQAVAMPHISNRNGITELEQGTPAANLQSALEQRGHQIKVRDMNSGIHAIVRAEDGRWYGAADPRREGLALGD
ncbi:gamma-glutamyltransferase [Motiliproteus sp.]|uniref:gamma-glutamyltransferase n=1 Tax=Motiliproteus sp. TaxID=1898955 RepID=UPI003BAC8CF7